ncbi:MAG TPA: PH domain-containing protein [Mucilaginibacter sp.]|nr:PH domain-containing protein [Mucilaginibacter sp.]
MQQQQNESPPVIVIRPAAIFAFIKILGLLFAAAAFLYLAWLYFPPLTWVSMFVMLFAVYRYAFIRKVQYTITPEYLQVRKGIFFREVDTVELFRIKDYILEQPFVLQIFRLMDLHLKTTDPENPEIWLRGIPLSNLVEQLRERVLETRKHNRIYEIN